jgi:hypothetical protein
LERAEAQIPFALAKALTNTIQDVKEAEIAEMRKAFNAPTPYTLRSLYVRTATKARQEASTWLKSYPGRPHYLQPQIEGGGRPLKRFERRMEMLGYMRGDQRAVPTRNVSLDAYGNMSRGQIVKILSQLRTDVVSGVSQNATNSKRSKAKRKASEYFVSKGSGSQRHGYAGKRGRGQMYEQHLPAGVWERRNFAWGSSVRPILLFVASTRYAKRFDFFGVADKVIAARLPVHLDASIKLALSTARLTHTGSVL